MQLHYHITIGKLNLYYYLGLLIVLRNTELFSGCIRTHCTRKLGALARVVEQGWQRSIQQMKIEYCETLLH